MILKRFADAMRRQDWFVVVLEMLIVVVGILIGLQVDDWSDSRKKQADIETQLARISEDARFILERTDGMLEIYDDALSGAKIVLDILDGAELTPDVSDAFNETLDNSYRMIEIQFDLPGLTILIESGDIRLIEDEAIRRALLNYSNEMRTRAKIIDHVKELLNIVNRDVFQFVSYDISSLNPEQRHGADFVIRYDLEALRANPRARVALSNAARMQGHARSQTMVMRARLQEMIEALDNRRLH